MKVVCIRGFLARDEICPIVGQVYTVRDVTNYFGIKAYRLHEIINKPKQYAEDFGECSFVASHFRPVTDISAFTKLTKVKERELEDA